MIFFTKYNVLITVLLACLGGALGVLAFSPFDLPYLMPISVTILVSFAYLKNTKQALLSTLCYSVVFFFFGLNWITVSMSNFGGVNQFVAYLLLLGLSLYLCIYNLIAIIVIRLLKLTKSGIFTPFAIATIFMITEYARGHFLSGFGWLEFGYSQTDTFLSALAPIFGVSGISFALLVIGTFIVQIMLQAVQKNYKFAIFYAIFIACLLAIIAYLSTISFTEKEDNTLKVALIQPNIDQAIKWNPNYFWSIMQTYDDLITPLLGKVDVIIMPESAIPAPEQHIDRLLDNIHQVAKQKNTSILLGGLTILNDKTYNSAIVLGKDQKLTHIDQNSLKQIERFNKYHLVPFGEYVPLDSVFGAMREVFQLPINLDKGKLIQKPFEIQNKKINMAICYEIAFGDEILARQQQYNSDYIVTISNDAWFGRSIGPWQHLQIARMRAMEHQKPIIRATNNGISAIISEQGKLVQKLEPFKPLNSVYNLTTTKGKTVFSSYGNKLIFIIGLLSLIISLGYLMLLHIYKNKRGQNE